MAAFLIKQCLMVYGCIFFGACAGTVVGRCGCVAAVAASSGFCPKL